MNNLQKNIILSVIFTALISSLFLVDSNIVHATLALLLFGTALWLNTLKTTSFNSSSLAQKRLELIEVMEFERNKIELNENTTDEAEKNFNRIVNAYQNSVLEDTKVAGEMVLLADKVSRGHYSCRIMSDSKLLMCMF